MDKAACVNHTKRHAKGLQGGLRPADYQRVMHTRPMAKTAHFTVHFHGPVDKLSTAVRASKPLDVDDTPEVNADTPVKAPLSLWRLGLVLPKKMARRSVTRSLIKHQARELWRVHLNPGDASASAVALPAGDWVLRLKAPWPRADFPSAASEPLKQLVREELQLLLQTCLSRTRAGEGSR
jgi:ribonuclease P protein component